MIIYTENALFIRTFHIFQAIRSVFTNSVAILYHKPPLADSPQSHSQLFQTNNTRRLALWKNSPTTTAMDFGTDSELQTTQLSG